MKPGGFVEAVTRAVNSSTGPDLWEIEYYKGQHIGDNHYEWDPRKQPVYMHSRNVALGPDWAEWIHCVMAMQGIIPRVQGWPRVPQETRSAS